MSFWVFILLSWNKITMNLLTSDLQTLITSQKRDPRNMQGMVHLKKKKMSHRVGTLFGF